MPWRGGEGGYGTNYGPTADQTSVDYTYATDVTGTFYPADPEPSPSGRTQGVIESQGAEFVWSENFEQGTDTAALVASGPSTIGPNTSFTTVFTTATFTPPAFTAASAIYGSLSARIAPGVGGVSYLEMGSGASNPPIVTSTVYQRAIVELETGWPVGGNINLMVVRGNAGANIRAQLAVTTAGVITLTDQTTVVYTSVATLPTSGPIRVEWFIDAVAGQQVKLWWGANLAGTTPDLDTGIQTYTHGAMDQFRWGMPSNATTSLMSILLDEIMVRTDTWCGVPTSPFATTWSSTLTATATATVTQPDWRKLTGTAAATATVAGLLTHPRSVSATGAATAAIAQTHASVRPLSATAAASASLTATRGFFRSLTATGAASASLTATRGFFRSLTATAAATAKQPDWRKLTATGAASASLTATRGFFRSLAATATASAKQPDWRKLTATGAASASLTATRGFFRSLAATAVASAKQPIWRKLSASVSASGTVGGTTTHFRAESASAAATAASGRTLARFRSLVATGVASATATRTIPSRSVAATAAATAKQPDWRKLTATGASTATVAKLLTHPRSVNATAVASARQPDWRKLSATATGTAALTGVITRIRGLVATARASVTVDGTASAAYFPHWRVLAVLSALTRPVTAVLRASMDVVASLVSREVKAEVVPSSAAAILTVHNAVDAQVQDEALTDAMVDF